MIQMGLITEKERADCHRSSHWSLSDYCKNNDSAQKTMSKTIFNSCGRQLKSSFQSSRCYPEQTEKVF